MYKFIVMNKDGEYGVESDTSGFGGNGSKKLSFTKDINKDTLFTNSSFNLVKDKYKEQIVAKIPAEEQRVVILTGGSL